MLKQYNMVINKTMDRLDLLSDKAQETIQSINNLVKLLYQRNLATTSWYGTLFDEEKPKGAFSKIKSTIKNKSIGKANRGKTYAQLPNAADDNRLPWYLYWEIYWVLSQGPKINSSMKLLDAGGTSSLFSCYVASLGAEVHSIDLNKDLVANANKISQLMGWRMHSYAMDMQKLDFPDSFFDHAYSICVFEHLTFDIKKRALSEIARCLKPNGVLSITFDYRNPAPSIAGMGIQTNDEYLIINQGDIERNFLQTPCFELMGNQIFEDNSKSFLVHPEFGNAPYTFGAIFLRKK
jgi:2-polyprenyl-3-methyl-5-hydroxy-6-metoxy-1,4-benzoquinol methylase